MKLDFLSQVTVSAAPKKAAAVSREKKERQPQGLRIRLFKDGSVYPSAQLIDEYELEYQPRAIPTDKPAGYGFDVIDSRDMTSQIQTKTPFVGVLVSLRKEGKLDLFASCKYDVDGAPMSSVAEQGSNTYGKTELIPLLEQVYGDNFKFNEQGFADLELAENYPITAPDARFFVFKKVARGPNAGKKDYVIRDGSPIIPLVPVAEAVIGDASIAAGPAAAK